MTDKLLRQAVALNPLGQGRAELIPCPVEGNPDNHLFSRFESLKENRPWALHLSLNDDEYRGLKEYHTWQTDNGKSGSSRRKPRWRRDSLVVWSPSAEGRQHVHMMTNAPSERARIGHAYRIDSKRYKERFESGEAENKRLIYIAGCGRSGTTLLQRLMRCFEDSFVAGGERPFTALLDLVNRDERNLVVKRDAGAWMLLKDMPPAVHLVYCVRHPYDVLTSFHPGSRRSDRYYIKPSRWKQEFSAYRKYCRLMETRPVVVRYEDLISDPDSVQESLAEGLGLEARMAFTDRNEPLSGRSIRKWEGNEQFSEYLGRVRRAHGKTLDAFMEEFGYDGKID